MKKIFKLNSKIVLMILSILIVLSFVIFLRKSNNEKLTFAEESNNIIIPKPLKYIRGNGKFIITKDTSIYVKGNTNEETEEISKIAEAFNNKIKTSTGFKLNIVRNESPISGSIYLTTTSGEINDGDEAYKITVIPENANIIASKPEGIFRGIQTLRQLLPPDIEKNTLVTDMEWGIESSTIEDKPEYRYRGLMIDVARHFFDVDEIKRQIDIAAQYKINKIHIHLSDDQGWRLEIKKWPDLATIGGSSEVGGGPGGYYNQEEFKDIVKYASDRYIEIIPEFDMPGHSNAMLASYDFLNEDGKKSHYIQELMLDLAH